MKAERLNKVLSTNIAMALRLKKRGGQYPETDFTTKEPTGRQVFLYIFEDKDGKELSFYASEQHEETLKLFNEREWLQVVRKEEMNDKTGKRHTRYEFTTPSGAEARAAAEPSLHKNTTQARLNNQQRLWGQRDKIKQVFISLAGIFQAHVSAGRTNAEALELADEGRQMILQRAIKIVLSDSDIHDD